MKILFWSCASLILLTYLGYPVYLYVRARFWPLPVKRASLLPNVSIVVAVHNEEKYLPTKLEGLAAIDYPPERLQVIVVSDGSTDDTNAILKLWQGAPSRTAVFADHRGKAAAVNRGLAVAQGEIVLFTDARQTLALDALKQLSANFADPQVGCVSGELMIGRDQVTACSEGAGLYWRLEKKMRLWEALTGSMVGATGAIYAVRKELLVFLPEGTILDDMYIPLHVARQGRRVVCDFQARAFDPLAPSPGQEFRRKPRTLFGNYQLLQLAPWLLTCPNPVRFRFLGHKLSRLLMPFALLSMLFSSAALHYGIYNFALILQLIFYALALCSFVRPTSGLFSRLSNVSAAFVVLNAAAATAFFYFLTGRKAEWSH